MPAAKGATRAIGGWRASVVSAVEQHHPAAIGVIDGVFLQDLSVWHKELLYAMEKGVAVFGASSMGALRAAELAPFGMRGVGEVYRQYAEGRLNDDDEVAVVHASSDAGHRKITEPMVNTPPIMCPLGPPLGTCENHYRSTCWRQLSVVRKRDELRGYGTRITASGMDAPIGRCERGWRVAGESV